MRAARVATLAAALALAAGCKLNPYELGGRVGDAGPGDGDGGLDAPPDAVTCTPIGVDDQCNEVDDDCDGVVDQAFDKQLDPNHCGQCNRRCVGAGAIQACQAGQCVRTACQPGFADLDADPLTCEYQCPLFPTIAEDCNGVDDDCDGQIDETLPAPPTGQCRVTPGTPCAGTSMVCETRAGITRWWCAYGAGVEFDPTVPNGIVLDEQLCDGADGDCDGLVDDAFPDLGAECDDGGLGVCRDVGERVCDPMNPAQTRCDLSVLPDAALATPEACDGLDNNCDGLVDNPPTPGAVIDDMVRITFGSFDFRIDAYEASRPDATALATGVSSARACSRPGVVPWRGATYAAAQAACAAAGKVLCSAAQWEAACEGATATTYPYGDTFGAATCNAEPNDGIAGGADDDVLLPTGALAACTTPGGVFDLSGNLKEWTVDVTGQASGVDIVVQRGGSYRSPAAGATCEFRLTRAAADVVELETGFRCCRAP